jgi:hypothetical protein
MLPASAQELHHHEGMSPEVDMFYSHWRQPNDGHVRSWGCCDKTDCYPTEARMIKGQWWYLHRETQRWMSVPDRKVEHLQPDPKESPDGRNHVCASPTGWVWCFVVGSLT